MVIKTRKRGGAGGGGFWLNHVFTGSLNAGQTAYMTLDQHDNPNLTEANVQICVPNGVTKLSAMSVYMTSANDTYNADITIRKNGNDTSLTIQYTGGQTGYKDIETDVDVVAGDLINIKVVCGTGGTGVYRPRFIGVKFE